MKRNQSSPWTAVKAALATLTVLAGVCSFGMAYGALPRENNRGACSTPEEALRRYVNAVNAGDFDAQYALFAPVEHEGAKSAPIPLLPEKDLQRLVMHLNPPFPAGMRIGSNPLHTYTNSIARKPGVIVYYLVPILAPGRPAPPRGKQSGSYAIFLQHTPDGWKIRAWATYWMYFQRPYGTAAGMRFRAAYRKEAERLGLRPRAGKAAVIAGAR